MGTNQVAARSAGQVILANFFNDIKDALVGTIVGRQSDGTPVSGCDVGSTAYPFAYGYFSSGLILGGSAFTTSQIESDSFQIISGKVRSGSNQPAFLLPTAGPAASFKLLATTTPLIYQVAGTAVTISADITSIPITTAPTSNNTALVNDAAATGTYSTKTWGEYGSKLPGGNSFITIDTVGSNITARLGSLQAFKVGAEYFIAYIATTTGLTQGFRGFFFDSSGNPIKRVALTDNDTITLMNLGWVFLDVNGSTVDTIFTGAGVNATPVWAYTQPSSPSSGDYWFDLSTNLWKRWNGASWATSSRILIGVVIADGTNCVGARAFDFFKIVRPENTVETVYLSATTMGVTTPGQRANVMGSRIQFKSGMPTWDTASHLAASADRYNASVTASRPEYLYLADTGALKISDMEPYWRADFYGYYHPYNPWRCITRVGVNGSAQFISGDAQQFLGIREGGKAPVTANYASRGLEVIRGYVAAAGTILSGEGFTVTGGGTGDFVVTFTNPFLTAPACVATPLASSLYAQAINVAATSVEFQFRSAGVLTSTGFHFIAIGDRA